MHRAGFLASVAALAISPATVRAQDALNDPASSSSAQALRVLLGRGEAVALTGGGFTFDGRPYRGSFVREPDGSVVTTVPLEFYLYSVVSREMSPSWPLQALAAQAVCARSYVLARSSPRRTYDLVPSEADQVYGGIASESAAARAAVDATAGTVLAYDRGFAQIMYSSCCGGHTQASSDAWGGAPFAYLGGVACPHCTASPNYRWRRTIALAQLASAFANELSPFGALREVRLGTVDSSGRPRQIELVGDTGSAFVRSSAFRTRVGARTIPSTLIFTAASAQDQPQSIALEGGGLGHGVGLCQWGARGMALEGASFSDILRFYFPGTTIAHD